jgi:hypothetical protein
VSAARGGTPFAQGADVDFPTDTHGGGRRRADVPRNPWRAKAKLIGAVAAGVIAGILMGILLVYLLLTPNAPKP